MLNLQGVTYTHPNGDLLFADLDLNINKYDKIALIGNNGAGKSTLLKILCGYLQPSQGIVKARTVRYLVPQLFGQFNDYTLARALQIEDKLKAITEILNGDANEANLALLDDDWAIEERCKEALAHWKLEGLDLNQKMESLSGGQKTRVFLAGIWIHKPEIVLLDEPTNHLDSSGRNLLCDYIAATNNTLVVVSHDRTLLNLLSTVYELSRMGITAYGGNYDFYAEQKAIAREALDRDLKNKEKALHKAKEVEKEALQRQQKLDARGKKKQEKAGLPTISMNTFKNNAEKSTSRMKGIHAEKVDTIAQELNQLRMSLSDFSKMKIGLDSPRLYNDKVLVTAKGINFLYRGAMLWKHGLDFQISSGQRIVVRGLNGSGKTTLIKMILGKLEPASGTIARTNVRTMYIDQDYSLINNGLSIYEQAQEYNSGRLREHDIKTRLNRFLFGREDWDKPCEALSGGEKMRLMLCCMTIGDQAPDIIVLDEPTNNLDIQNIEILTAAINEYSGALIVVSHDEYFLNEINVERKIVIN